MKVTSLEQLKQIKLTDIIELPSFKEGGEPFIVEAKRPNMLQLVSSGVIPNHLLSSAMKIFKNGVSGAAQEAMEDAKALKELSGLMTVIAHSTLVSPSYETIQSVGLELTEAQLVDLMNYMQHGVKSLSTFRNK